MQVKIQKHLKVKATEALSFSTFTIDLYGLFFLIHPAFIKDIVYNYVNHLASHSQLLFQNLEL